MLNILIAGMLITVETILFIIANKWMQSEKRKFFSFSSILFTIGSLFHLSFYNSFQYLIPFGCLCFYLLYGIFEDIRTKEIYSVIHYPLIGIGIISLIAKGVDEKEILFILVSNAILQFVAMKKNYGLADCKLFFTLSLFYDYSRWQIDPLLFSCFHILFSLIIFVLYNAIKGNLKEGWKLKEPTEFIPSIALAALLFV